MRIHSKISLKAIILLNVILILFDQCTESNKKPNIDDSELCSSFGFTESRIEQINRIKKAFVVKNICGSVVLIDGSPMCAGVIFEIRKKVKNWKSEKVYKTITDEKGEFVLKGIKQGRYCFKLTFEGWQSIVGEILLTEKADKKNRINLTMELGL